MHNFVLSAHQFQKVHAKKENIKIKIEMAIMCAPCKIAISARYKLNTFQVRDHVLYYNTFTLPYNWSQTSSN
jgi:3-dehydroquinate dehydratase